MAGAALLDEPAKNAAPPAEEVIRKFRRVITSTERQEERRIESFLQGDEERSADGKAYPENLAHGQTLLEDDHSQRDDEHRGHLIEDRRSPRGRELEPGSPEHRSHEGTEEAHRNHDFPYVAPPKTKKNLACRPAQTRERSKHHCRDKEPEG